MAASAFAVESANTVGYEVQSYEGPRTQSVRFQGVGSNGSAVSITNVLDGTLVADYSDTIEIYDGETGDFTAYMWDTETWFDALTDAPITISVVPGNAFGNCGEGFFRLSYVCSEEQLQEVVDRMKADGFYY